MTSAREAVELFCEVLVRHGGTERSECTRLHNLPCVQLHRQLDSLRAEHAVDARYHSALDGGGAINARALAHNSNRRLYLIALATALDVAACRH